MYEEFLRINDCSVGSNVKYVSSTESIGNSNRKNLSMYRYLIVINR